MKSIICRILLVVFFISSITPGAWAQSRGYARMTQEEYDRAVAQVRTPPAVRAQMRQLQTAHLVQNLETKKQVHQQFAEAFEYQDIVQAVYGLHSFYDLSLGPLDDEDRAFQDAVEANYDRVAKLYKDTIIPDYELVPFAYRLAPIQSGVLEQISKNDITPEQILDYIDPLKSYKKNNWHGTLYAAMVLSNTVATTKQAYPGLESYLRHAQMRVLYRLSQVDVTKTKDNLTIEAAGQLRVTLMSLHMAYKRLYGKDPLEDFKSSYPYPRQLGEVVVTSSKRPDASRQSMRIMPKNFQTAEINVYEKMRRNFMQEIRHWKGELPNDRYSFTKLVTVLKNRNQTANFSFWDAAGDVAADVFFVTTVKSLGGLLFGSGDDGKTPTANLMIMTPIAVEYDLLENNFSHVKAIVDTLESQKLAERSIEMLFEMREHPEVIQPAVVIQERFVPGGSLI